MSLSLPALLAGTRSKRALKILSSAPTGFMLLGTTVPYTRISPCSLGTMLVCSRGSSPIVLTPWIDADDPHVEAAELCGQQSNEMISPSLASGITGEGYVRNVMHARARARDDDGTATFLSAKPPTTNVKTRGSGQQRK